VRYLWWLYASNGILDLSPSGIRVRLGAERRWFDLRYRAQHFLCTFIFRRRRSGWVSVTAATYATFGSLATITA
jgi:hypothetical protein